MVFLSSLFFKNYTYECHCKYYITYNKISGVRFMQEIIDIEYIKYIKDKYKIDCFYIDKNFKFYYMTFCNKCGKIILKDIKYQIENIKDDVLNDLYNILDDNKIEFIDFFNNKLDMEYFCSCRNDCTIYDVLYN